jgi:hypothetical protein
MRKSIIAGLTLLSAALAGFAGAAQAHDKDGDGAPPAHRAHAHKQVRQIAETLPPTTQFRIPAHPVVRDCVHVMFPQCGRGYDGLNDGQFNTPYR